MSGDLPAGVTGVLALADGTILPGLGCGMAGEAVGEVCFNTAMTGYQEILTDPSYMDQIIVFTFPHIGNVGANAEDIEQVAGNAETAACGVVFRAAPTAAANWRSNDDLSGWLSRRGVVGLSGVDTRALTKSIREKGMPHGVIAHDPRGRFDTDALVQKARAWNGLKGADLAKDASCARPLEWDEGAWGWPAGYAAGGEPRFNVVVVDYGVKRNILRSLVAIGARVSVVPAATSAGEILARAPDGVVLSNGPGDPAATARHASSVIRDLVESGTPMLGICMGHQLWLWPWGSTVKMEQGHHGANHPVKDVARGTVEIVSMNHGFTVAREGLPDCFEETHLSLFDGSNAGLSLIGRPVISVQHHPEASPGPSDALHVFARFAELMGDYRRG